ncbi:WxL protein peptidoglycan domain-containing protein [Microbacterium sp. NPDC055683]
MTRTRSATAALAAAVALLLAVAAPAAAAPAAETASASPVVASASPVAAASASEGVAWGVEPGGDADRANFDYEVDPGAVVEDAMVVRNTGTESLALGVYAADAYTTAEGVLDLRLADEPLDDSGAWIALDVSEIVLAPGESAEVPFTVTVPADASPGDHPAGVVTSLVTRTDGEPLAVDRRLGIRLNLRVSGELTPSAEIVDANAVFAPSWNPFAGGSVTVTYRLENTGNTRVLADDAVALAGPLGVGAVALGAQTTPEVVPGSTIVVERVLADVPAIGWLTGAVTLAPAAVGLGAQPLAAVTVELSTPAVSWTLCGLLVLVVAGVVLALVLLRRSRARREEPRM